MTEKDFKTILSRGTTRQRAMLIANHLAEDFFGEGGLLTEQELNNLYDSIKSKDQQIYNLIMRVENILRTCLFFLEWLRSDYRQVLTAINGLVLWHRYYEQQEDLVNSLLPFVRIKDRPAALSAIADDIRPIFADIIFSKGGTRVTIDTDRKVTKAKQPEEITLFDLLAINRERARNIVTEAKTIMRYCNEVMEHKDVEIKPYKERLRLIELFLKTEKPRSFIKEELIGTENNPYGLYKVLDDYDSIEIDETSYQQLKYGN